MKRTFLDPERAKFQNYVPIWSRPNLPKNCPRGQVLASRLIVSVIFSRNYVLFWHLGLWLSWRKDNLDHLTRLTKSELWWNSTSNPNSFNLVDCLWNQRCHSSQLSKGPPLITPLVSGYRCVCWRVQGGPFSSTTCSSYYPSWNIDPVSYTHLTLPTILLV